MPIAGRQASTRGTKIHTLCEDILKNKEVELGWKDSFPVNGSLVKDKTTLLDGVGSTGYYQGNLIPTLHNTYQRSYYISQDGLFRITLDWDQSFKLPFSTMKSLPHSDFPVIIELKYDRIHSARAKDITDYLAFRQTKNSKYVVGIQELYF